MKIGTFETSFYVAEINVWYVDNGRHLSNTITNHKIVYHELTYYENSKCKCLIQLERKCFPI